MYSVFPFNLIPQNSNIIFYGGGIAGKNYLSQVWATNWCQVIAVCDREQSTLNIRNTELILPSAIEQYDYDYIFVTPLDKNVREEIYNNLLNLGVSKDKVLWNYDVIEKEWNNPDVGFLKQEDEYTAKKDIPGYLEEIDPHLLVTSKRIDMAVRYLLFRDFTYGMDNKENLSLFSRFIFCRTGGKEEGNYFSDAGKETVLEYIEKGRELCRNMMQSGFRKEKFIPLGIDNHPFDGLHRIAAALVTGENIWTHNYNNRSILECDYTWFEEHGFSVEDKLRILRGFSDIYPGHMGIFILYGPCKEQWNFIEKQMKLKYTVVGAVTLNFNNYYIAFENILREIYWDTNHYSEWLTRKLELLFLAPLEYRVVLVSDEDRSISDFYGSIHDFKKKVRECLQFEIDSNVPIQIHSSDNYEEFLHLKRIFLSVNNIRYEKQRMNKYYNGHFLNMIERLRQWCAENKIDTDDVCIIGSAVLELYGLRSAKNVNFVCREGINIKETGDEQLELFAGKDYFYNETGEAISADCIINNEDCYTVFGDFKFCNLEYVYRYKQKRNHEKDKLDVAKITQYEKCINHMREEAAMKQQIRIELEKRGIKDYE